MRCELSLRAIRLPQREGVSQESALIAVVTKIATTHGDEPKCLGRTEEIYNDLSPSWNRVFQFEWNLGTPLKLCVQIYEKLTGRNKYKLNGSASFEVEFILGSPGSRCAKRLKGGGLLVAGIKRGRGPELRLQLKGLRLRKVLEGFTQRTHPFYEIHKRTENADGFIDWELVYRSTTILDNLNPVWPVIALDCLSLGEGNFNHPLKIIVFHHMRSEENEYMGETQVSVNRLLDSTTDGHDDPSRAIPLTLMKTKKSNKTRAARASGKIMVLQGFIRGGATAEEKAVVPLGRGSIVLEGKYNLLDYLANGCQFDIILAVDFSGSNGYPGDPGTLHYLDPSGCYNDYEKAMIAMLNALSHLDADHHFSLWGFGAKYNDELHNVFQCGTTRLIPGVEAVLQAYRDQFRSGLTMANTPTVFTDVIRTAAAHAERAAQVAKKFNRQVYTILCIFSDGDAESIDDTAKALDDAIQSPISVIIVGIGEGNFSNMRFIDHARHLREERDVAHFVHFNQFCQSSQKFTSEACQELPQQITDYFDSKGMIPLQNSEDVSDANIIRLPYEEEPDVVIQFSKEDVPLLTSGGRQHLDIFQELSSVHGK